MDDEMFEIPDEEPKLSEEERELIPRIKSALYGGGSSGENLSTDLSGDYEALVDLTDGPIDELLPIGRGRTRLMIACASPMDVSLVEQLIEAGANPTQLNNKGQNALQWACGAAEDDPTTVGPAPPDTEKRVRKVELLLNNGASVSDRDEDGRTPLHYACKKKYVPVVEKLLANGADPTVRDDEGRTPLHEGCSHPGSVRQGTKLRCLGVLEILLDQEIEVNPRNDEGVTPLMLLVQNPYVEEEALERLIEAGAQTEMEDQEGRTPLELARQSEPYDDTSAQDDTIRVLKEEPHD